METVTFELWHITMILVLLGTIGSAWFSAKLFNMADKTDSVGHVVFGVLVLIITFFPCLVAWVCLFQRFISNVLKTMA